MSENGQTKNKKKEWYSIITIDEAILFMIGAWVFSFPSLESYKLYFVGAVIIWYWFRLKIIENKIHLLIRSEYNVYFDHAGQGGFTNIVDGKTERDRSPMRYERQQLENERKNLVDKFVIINLILLILIKAFV